MVIRGRVTNGVVVLDDASALPEGAEVSVSYPAAHDKSSEEMSEMQRRGLLGELERLRSLPNENPGDDFDAVEHDRLLYGNP
jgi:hypothetical protein